MSGLFCGAKNSLGEEYLKGADAYFRYINENGGVYGRFIKVIHKDDRYEPKIAEENAEKLIKDDKIFAFFGVIGTPTSKAILPVSMKKNIPFLTPFSGAKFLREPPNPMVLNIRAGYDDEAEKLISYFADYKKFTRIAVLYQNDSYGRDGLRGVRKALYRRNLKIIGEGSYKRNTLSVGNALYEISLTRPEAVILVASTMPAVEFVKRARSNKRITKGVYFGALSFIDPVLMSENLRYRTENVVFSEVVPSPWHSRNKDVIRYRELFSKYFPNRKYGFISLEGFLAAKIVAEVFKEVGADFTKSDFINGIRRYKEYELPKRFGYLKRVHLFEYRGKNFVSIRFGEELDK